MIPPPGTATRSRPAERDGRLYGRGAADDKAGIAVRLAALRAYGDELPVGVTVLAEGEEEVGSPTLEEFLAAYAGRLRADVAVFADAANWTAEDVPSLTTTLRGGTSVHGGGPDAGPRHPQRPVRRPGSGRADHLVPVAGHPA